MTTIVKRVVGALLAVLGLGLIVMRRSDDLMLMLSTARALAGAYVVMLAISLTYFFIIPTIIFLTIVTRLDEAVERPRAR